MRSEQGPQRESSLHPGITMHKLPVQAGFPGVLFTGGCLLVFLVGIPPLRYFAVGAGLLGAVIALGFQVARRFQRP